MKEIKSGSVLGQWTITGDRPLGKGGNGVVWRASCKKHGDVAIKLLHRNANEQRRQRFLQEIGFLRKNPQLKGILPILDSFSEMDPIQQTVWWYAMPLARPLRDQLRGNSLEEKVKTCKTLGEILGELHREAIFHRDIKPDNLFWWNDGPVFGDFGLVAFSGMERNTQTDEKLGPTFFIAPEALLNTIPLDREKVDVFSFAKSIWVLATEQNFPPPGPLSLEEDLTNLSVWVKHPRIKILQQILHGATKNNPESRPGSTQFANQLSIFLDETKEVSLEPIRDMSWEFRVLETPRQIALKAHRERYAFLSELVFPHFQKSVANIEEAVASKTALRKVEFNQSYLSSSELDRLHAESRKNFMCCFVFYKELGVPRLQFQAGYIISSAAIGSVVVTAVIAFSQLHGRNSTLHYSDTVTLDSKEGDFVQRIRDIQVNLDSNMQSGLDAFVQFVKNQ